MQSYFATKFTTHSIRHIQTNSQNRECLTPHYGIHHAVICTNTNSGFHVTSVILIRKNTAQNMLKELSRWQNGVTDSSNSPFGETCQVSALECLKWPTLEFHNECHESHTSCTPAFLPTKSWFLQPWNWPVPISTASWTRKFDGPTYLTAKGLLSSHWPKHSLPLGFLSSCNL